jgi:hypothetical protein
LTSAADPTQLRFRPCRLQRYLPARLIETLLSLVVFGLGIAYVAGVVLLAD